MSVEHQTEREPQVRCDDWLGELEGALRSQRYLAQRMRAGGASFVATQMEYTLRCLEMEIEDRRRSPSKGCEIGQNYKDCPACAEQEKEGIPR